MKALLKQSVEEFLLLLFQNVFIGNGKQNEREIVMMRLL
jgi:hypothetical protein